MGLEVFRKQQWWKSAGGSDVGQHQKTGCKLAVWHSNKAGQSARARLTVESGQREQGDVHLTGLTC